MTKYFLIAVIIVSLVALIGCSGREAVLNENVIYEMKSDINSLDVQITAADFVIEQGDKLFVESNLKNLSVTEEDGVLKIVDKTKRAVNFKNWKTKGYFRYRRRIKYLFLW